jgi:RNA polymerase sigma factor (sigma-70 family)
LKNGCAQAADEIIRSCELRITSLAARYSRPETDRRDELEQLGRIAAWQVALRYDPEHGPFGHLATRAITNNFKKSHRSLTTDLRCRELDLEEAEHMCEPSAALNEVDLRDLSTCLEPKPGQVYRLLYLDGCTQREAGGELGISQSRVAQFHRAVISRLRSELSLAA